MVDQLATDLGIAPEALLQHPEISLPDYGIPFYDLLVSALRREEERSSKRSTTIPGIIRYKA